MKRLLIAGIGNVFLGDDGFGPEVARHLIAEPWPEGVVVRDFGTRSYDLAMALTDGIDGVILIDAMQHGEAPGTLFVMEPTRPDKAVPVVTSGHSLTPAVVLQMAGGWGDLPTWLRVVGCEPLTFGSEDEPAMGLSGPVSAVVLEAAQTVTGLARHFLDSSSHTEDTE